MVFVCVPDDVLYLPDEGLLQEYVINEDGVIYMGTWDYINSIPWNYGQVTPPHTHSLGVNGLSVPGLWVACVNCHRSVTVDTGSGNLLVG